MNAETGRHAEKGFTLLEVLVALAILAIGAAVTLSLISGSLRNVRKVQQRTRSIEHAEYVMESALLDESIRQPASLTGNFPDGTRWIVHVEEYETPDDQQPADTVANMPVKLLSYSVEVTGPESNTPDCRLHTLKIVKAQTDTQPMGMPQ